MSDSHVCGVCGQPIDPKDSRFVDVQKGTKIHVHTGCKTKG
jgi:hypothetical protein